MASKNIMKEIGDAMEKIFYKKKETKKEVTPVETVVVAEPEPIKTPSPWQKATDLDAKMKKRLKDAGVE